MADVFVAFGSNVGDKETYLREAVTKLRASGAWTALSSLYVTEPVGVRDQDWFLNAVGRLRTALRPGELMRELLRLEAEAGRERVTPGGPRTLDLDILFWDELVLKEPDLEVPHPRLHERRFVLEPFCEIAPHVLHPVLGRTAAQLRDALQGGERVDRYDNPAWEALRG